MILHNAPEAGQEDYGDMNDSRIFTESRMIGHAVQGLNDLAVICHARADAKGFPNPDSYADTDIFLAKLMLIVSECGEVASCIQDRSHEDIPEEMADIFIRLFDLCGAVGIEIGDAVAAKLAKNLTRPAKHGKVI